MIAAAVTNKGYQNPETGGDGNGKSLVIALGSRESKIENEERQTAGSYRKGRVRDDTR